jgi:hypothetical protein
LGSRLTPANSVLIGSPSWLEGLDITGASNELFQPNTAFVLHSYVTTSDRFGILIGGAYIPTDTGLECLSGGGLDLVTCSLTFIQSGLESWVE